MTYPINSDARLTIRTGGIPRGSTVRVVACDTTGHGSLRHTLYRVRWGDRSAIVPPRKLAPCGGMAKVGGGYVL